jgi:hypothetical protein
MVRNKALGMMVCGVVLAAAPAVAGPISQYYLTAGDAAMNWVVQGTGVVISWPQVGNLEYPIVVLSTVRTTSANGGAQGGEYTLAGAPTGTMFTNSLPGGQRMYDGATDGLYNYAVSWLSGEVTRCNLDWSTPQVLFNLGSTESDLAITYDPSTNSLWIGEWNNAVIRNYTLSGSLLSSFNVSTNNISCLALDPTDGTL